MTIILNINIMEKDITKPTEEEVLNTIFKNVFIRGIDLEVYRKEFENERSGLYDALVKLFDKNTI